MHQRSSQSFSWSAVLSELRASSGQAVFVRDGKVMEAAGSVRNRAAAKGSELCLFPGEPATTRLALIEQLAALAKSAGRRFATSARARVGDAYLLIEGVVDETIDGTVVTVIKTRRPKLGYNQSQQVGDSTTFRSKRIKQW